MTDTRFASLAAALTSAGCPTGKLDVAGQGTVLVMPNGGRVIGLFAGENSDNMLWANPALYEAESARALLKAEHWGLGGDRTWLSPEIDLHLGDLADPWGTYAVPRAVDPGHYHLTERAHRVDLRSQMSLNFHHQKTTCEVEVEKSVRLLANPLRLEPGFSALAGVDYAGYELTTTLRLLEPTVSAPFVSLWNLLVVPVTGWAIVPVLGATRVRDIVAPTPPERLLSTEHAVCFLLDGQEQHKISVRAAAVRGRAGYLRSVDRERSTLLVRNFAVNPSGDYVDAPWDAPDELGYAFQSYNDDGKLGGFGELEHHSTAIGGRTGLDQVTDVCQVWGYSGPSADIRRIADYLLGVDSLALLGERR